MPENTSTNAATSDSSIDIDAIFGPEPGSEGLKDAVDTPSGNDGLPPVESEIFDGVTNVGRTNFKGQDNTPRNPQEVIARLQSERDKALSQVKDWETQASNWKTANDFLGELESDADVRRAFMHELDPELVKPKNPYSLIKETLGEEFKDFTPNPDEANVFGSKTWMYNQRANDLLTEAKTKWAIPESLKGLREKRKKDSDTANAAALKEKQDIMTGMSWDDNTWSGFATWMQSSKGEDFAKIYSYILRKGGKKPGNLATQRGYNINSNAAGHFSELDPFFGVTNPH